MHIKNWKIILVILCCDRALGSPCPGGFFEAAKDTCFHVANPGMSSMEQYCHARNSKLLGHPLNQEMMDNLAKEMKRIADHYMPPFAYLGMQNKAEKNPWQSSANEWHFEGEDDYFSPEEYQYWHKPPDDNENCAMTGPFIMTYKALPTACSRKIAILCQKDKPCYDKDTNYMNYRGLCLVLMGNDKAYDVAKTSCPNGHLMHLKEESHINSIKLTFYNTRFAGGVYIGLNKTDDKWTYLNGASEEDGFAEDDENLYDCGGVRLLEDETLGIYSIPCDGRRLYFLCEIAREYFQQKWRIIQ